MSSRKTVAADLASVIGRLVDAESVQNFVPHGNAKWTAWQLTATALCWAWGVGDGLKRSFECGRQVTARLLPGEGEVPASYQGFMPLIRRHSAPLLRGVVDSLRHGMRRSAGEYWTVAGRAVFAVDGTRVEVPRTSANEAAFQKLSGEKSPRPQMWLTILWHVGCGLPWDWRRGPGHAGERTHLREMLGSLPSHSLLVADAGFTGYDLWSELLAEGHDFLIRVGSNVRLLKSAGRFKRRGDVVLLWPANKRKAGCPPIILRLIRVQTGRHEMVLVTNLWDRRDLKKREALEIYRRRWGVEVFIRDFKQTFGRRRLRSGVPRNAERELDWSLAALWGLRLIGAEELIERGEDPSRLSTAGAYAVLRGAIASVLLGPSDLPAALAILADDGYRRRDKSSRDYPRKKREPTPSTPHLRHANTKELIDLIRLTL
jgi:hypothetical protein